MGYDENKTIYEKSVSRGKEWETEVEFAKLAYVDTVQGIAGTKQTSWNIVRWTIGLIFGVVTLVVTLKRSALDHSSILFFGIVILFLAAVGSKYLRVVHADLRELRKVLEQLRHAMGGLVAKIYYDSTAEDPNEVTLQIESNLQSRFNRYQLWAIYFAAIVSCGFLFVVR